MFRVPHQAQLPQNKKVLDSKMVMEKNDENIGPQLICTKLSLRLPQSMGHPARHTQIT